MLDQLDEQLGEDFPLWDVIEKFDREQVFTEELERHKQLQSGAKPETESPDAATPGAGEPNREGPPATAPAAEESTADSKESPTAPGPTESQTSPGADEVAPQH